MIVEALFSATVANLEPRPTDLAPDPGIYSEWLAGKVIEFDAQLAGSSCPTATVRSLGGGVGGPAPFAVPEPDRIVSNAFYEFLQFEGCGRSRKPNLFVVRLQSGGWRAVGMLYGESNAELRLQFDTIPTAQLALMQTASCQDLSTFQFEEVRLSRPRDATGAWEEVWPATACGRTVAVQVSFTPNPLTGGTGFSIKGVEP